MKVALTLAVMMVATGTARALPPGAEARGFVDGANHHVGDAGFVAFHGRAPTSGDSEKERMSTHLRYMRALLDDRPATRPELSAKRATLLGYLDEYIAAEITPRNFDVPWRSPVFVDALGHVCAVGYLIERSVGRALVERIDALHHTDFLEDIAASMPEVAAWVAASGLTLDELASIQPGYSEPLIEQWEHWQLEAARPADGPWLLVVAGVTTRGAWKHGQMDGRWTREDSRGRVIGQGDFAQGRGTWTSFDATGRTIATGAFSKSYPAGTWRLFHPSGALAATGPMAGGHRFGTWTFYHDGAERVPVARGRFARGGRVAGTWTHHDATGRVVATTWRGRDADWGEVLRMDVKPARGLRHRLSEGTFMAEYQRVDAFSFEGALYFRETYGESEVLYTADGEALVRGHEVWAARDCAWNSKLLSAARRGDPERVRSGLFAWRRDVHAMDRCDAVAPVGLSSAETARLDRLVGVLAMDRVPAPEFVKAWFREPLEDNDPDASPVEAATEPSELGATDGADDAPDERADPDLSPTDSTPTDLVKVLAANMSWYVEWPHIDGLFGAVFATLPSHYAPGELYALAEPNDGSFDTDDAGVMRIASRSEGNVRPVVPFR